MQIAVVIPTYNEKDNIHKLITDIFALQIPNLEILVIDDNSPDKTADIVEKLQNIFPVHLIKRSSKLGLGSAYILGFQKVLSLGAEKIIQMDADFSHNPQDIPRLLQASQNFDMVIGSRKIAGGKIIGWNLTRKFMSAGAMIFSRIFLNLKVKDVTSGFRLFDKKVLEKIPLNHIKSNGYAFQEEMLWRTQTNNFRITELPVTFIDRQKGQSKLSKKDIFEFFKVMIKLRFAGQKKVC